MRTGKLGLHARVPKAGYRFAVERVGRDRTVGHERPRTGLKAKRIVGPTPPTCCVPSTTKINVTLMLMPAAIESSIAVSPSRVAGILTILRRGDRRVLARARTSRPRGPRRVAGVGRHRRQFRGIAACG